MAVYYKFKSAKDFDSIPIDGHFISVINLKEKIFASKYFGRGKDFDLEVTNAQTGEEYLEESFLIPKNTSVLIRRVPGQPRNPIVTKPEVAVEQEIFEIVEPAKTCLFGNEFPDIGLPQDSEWDEFGNDLYTIPEVAPKQLIYPVFDSIPPNKEDEENKIKALIDTPALDWLSQASDGLAGGRGFGRGGGRMQGGGGRQFGRGIIERRTPPPGYVCHRCKVPGHLIQHCPTNGDPNYDLRRVKPPTGIPRSMLIATPDGSYSLPSGAVAVLRPNEAAFEKEIEGLPSTRPIGDLPPELRCPLCKEVMRDAVLTSKCCFMSFCDKCIREHIISKSLCVCGAVNVLADDLLPNKTLRDAINRVLESNNSSTENAGSTVQVQDLESALPIVPSPNLSASSTGIKNNRPVNNLEIHSNDHNSEKGHMSCNVDVSEATFESAGVRENFLQGGTSMADEEVQQKTPGELGKKKKKKKTRPSINDMVWQANQDSNFMMPFMYNPYWNGGIDPTLMNAYAGAMPSSYMGFHPTPSGGPFDNPHFSDPLAAAASAAQGYILPTPPLQTQRVSNYNGNQSKRENIKADRIGSQYDKSEMRRNREGSVDGRGMEDGRVMMSNRPTAYMRRGEEDRQQSRRHGERSPSQSLLPRGHRSVDDDGGHRDRGHKDNAPNAGGHHHHHHRRKYSSGDDRDRGHRSMDDNGGGGGHHHHRQRRSDSPRERLPPPPPLPPTDDCKHKLSVFSRISFPEGGEEVEEGEEGEASPAKKMKSSGQDTGGDKEGVREDQNGWCRAEKKSPVSEKGEERRQSPSNLSKHTRPPPHTDSRRSSSSRLR